MFKYLIKCDDPTCQERPFWDWDEDVLTLGDEYGGGAMCACGEPLKIQKMEAVSIQELNDKLTYNLGFFKSVYDSALGLSTEVGELQDIVRKLEGGKKVKEGDAKATREALEGEIADVLVYLGQIATHYGIDMYEAFKNKTNKIRNRKFMV